MSDVSVLSSHVNTLNRIALIIFLRVFAMKVENAKHSVLSIFPTFKGEKQTQNNAKKRHHRHRKSS